MFISLTRARAIFGRRSGGWGVALWLLVMGAVVVGCGGDAKPANGSASTAISGGNNSAQNSNAQVAGTVVGAKLVLTPAGEVGPYWVEEKLNRQDITTEPDGSSLQAGVPLALALKIFNVVDNQPIPLAGAMVDIWQANALGVYSDEAGENTSGQKWLRGHQIADATGGVQFKTIVPGWYSGRTTHIHARVRVYPAGNTTTPTYNWTTHLFMDDALTDRVYATAPYLAHGGRDTHNTNDHVYQVQCALGSAQVPCGTLMTLSVGVEGSGYAASGSIYLDTSTPVSTAASDGGMGGAGPPPQ